MRYRQLTTGTLALGVVLLIDVLRVWLPGIITIFGQAASTPAELMGAFALGWFVLAMGAPAVVRRVGARPVTVVAAVVLAVARLVLTAAPGGRTQLWLATAGLLAGLVWLVGTAADTDRPVPGLALGFAVNAALHAVLDTFDLVWRGDWVAWLLSSVAVALFLFGTALFLFATAQSGTRAGVAQSGTWVGTAQQSGTRVGGGGGRAWLLAGPALLLTGMVALSPALARTGMSYLFVGDNVARSPLFGMAPVPVAVAGFLFTALTRPPSRWGRAYGPVALLAGAVLFALDRGDLLLPAILLAAVGLGACLALTDDASHPENGTADAAGTADATDATGGKAGGGQVAVRRGYAVAAGMLVFALGAVGYYSAYDLGYPNAAVPVVVAVLVAVVAFTARPVVDLRPGPFPLLRAAGAVTVLALLAPVLADEVPVASNRDGPPQRLTVVAYNIRMGFGLDGRFDLTGLTEAVHRQRPDVVLLSEVDRAWLLNGGHDTLDLLADRLGMPYVFGPAADPVWGDAVLSRWPVTDPRTLPLPAVGAPTGAQALAVTLDLGDGVRTAVVSTHLQPPPGQGPVDQARAVADFAIGYAAGRPLVVAGDLNTEPGDEAFGQFTNAGLADALAAARPLATSPADDPHEQIDHIFVSPGLTPSDPVAVRSTASDHLPVAVTLTLPPR
ncbi:endonuclease/exonuclease/phosphatase family metal-dependent hydrolase [Micromonospora luteifusca]|uniref:Endonuclease/exonuclease/phosphatase family metal-dependent hydrolase n=1 Tax=Micromonospora luteifusca TaxID=709860 RepID=A0ABS2LXK6_9ACTN|nr:endonuclease/exonuclease/phosphatase family protein [Micromonospora luteifusca]MBM7492929.1 endonuclease/exonuclease/phosphatase family metal-dependent hydrolase [Micromonospora luteifusca]